MAPAYTTAPMTVREPAANRGHMVRPLREYFAQVEAADIFDYGAGFPVQDYLFGPDPEPVDWTITNPPFRLAELIDEVEDLRAANAELARQLAVACEERDEAMAGRTHWRDRAMLWSEVASDRGKTLRAIAEQEKPTSNATVKRMARMAREALE